MADYGVPADPADALPWEWARQRLVASRNYWVVTASATGRPGAMPVWGVWSDDPDGFWFSCSPNARKARNLAVNPAMTVMADDTVEVVSVDGVATLVAPEARVEFGRRYAEKYAAPDEREQLAAFATSHAVFVCRPQRAYGIIEREAEFAAKATRWVWPG
jgi:flavin reductase (DIM6/NTAB) family NADH-FMN oxidoreductase RutF